jgi:hypothetical protein
MPSRFQFLGDGSGGAARPAQAGHRIASRMVFERHWRRATRSGFFPVGVPPPQATSGSGTDHILVQELLAAGDGMRA